MSKKEKVTAFENLINAMIQYGGDQDGPYFTKVDGLQDYIMTVQKELGIEEYTAVLTYGTFGEFGTKVIKLIASDSVKGTCSCPKCGRSITADYKFMNDHAIFCFDCDKKMIINGNR